MITENQVTIPMGKPITSPVFVPVEHKSTPKCILDPFMVDGKCYPVTAISFGNPHGAVFVDDINAVDVEKVGVALGTHALFPKGANIVFVQVVDYNNIKTRLWVRGEGETMFSTEAACVAGTAAIMCKEIYVAEINIEMGGNKLVMHWDKSEHEVKLTGPAGLLLEG